MRYIMVTLEQWSNMQKSLVTARDLLRVDPQMTKSILEDAISWFEEAPREGIVETLMDSSLRRK